MKTAYPQFFMDKIDKYIKNRAYGIDSIDALCSIINFVLQYRLFERNNNISVADLIKYSNISDDTRYSVFKIPKKRVGLYRVITAPNGRLKSILKAVNILLSLTYDRKPYVTGFVQGASVVKNASLHTHQKFVFNIDLHNFFGTIYFNNLVNKLKSNPYNYSTEVAEIIAGLSSVKDPISGAIVLAQGSPSSPILSNILCNSMDEDLYELSQRYKVIYSRYADDITFSGRKNIFNYNSEFVRNLNSIIEKYDFIVNFSKVRFQHKDVRQVVTGLTVNSKVNVSRNYVKDIRNILYIWERYGYKDAYCSFAKHYNTIKSKGGCTPNIIGYVHGKLSFLRLVKGENDSTYIKLASRFKSLVNKEHKNFRSETIFNFKKFIKATLLVDFDWGSPKYNSYGVMYYNSPTGLIVVSPMVADMISDNENICDIFESYCCVHKIYDKDNIKWLISLRSDKCNVAKIKNDSLQEIPCKYGGNTSNLITVDEEPKIVLTVEKIISLNIKKSIFGSPHIYFCAVSTMDFDGLDFAGPPISDFIKVYYNGKASLAMVYSLGDGGEDKTIRDAAIAAENLGLNTDAEVLLMNHDTRLIKRIKYCHSYMDMLFLLSDDTKIG